MLLNILLLKAYLSSILRGYKFVVYFDIEPPTPSVLWISLTSLLLLPRWGRLLLFLISYWEVGRSKRGPLIGSQSNKHGIQQRLFPFFFLIFLSRSSSPPPPRLFPFFKLNKSWLCLEMSHWSCSLTFVLPTVVLFAVNMTPSSERCSKSHLDRPIQLCLPLWAKEPIAQCGHSALSRDFVRKTFRS